MPRIISTNTIKAINECYLKVGTYAETARRIGVSPSTVKKYIIPNYIPVADRDIKEVQIPNSFPKVSIPQSQATEWKTYLNITTNELEGLNNFRQEVL